MINNEYNLKLNKELITKLREILDTLPSFCKNFFRGIEPRTTIKTRLAYAYDLQVFFAYLKNNNPLFKTNEISLSDLDNLSFIDFEEYMEYLKYYLNKNEKEILNTNSGIKRKISTLKSFYKYFFNNDLIKNNPVSKISIPKIRDKDIIRLDNLEMLKLINIVEKGEFLTEKEKKFHSITKNRDLAIITLLLGTGIRVSECVGINIKDIDFENTAIRIIRKGEKEVNIYFSDEVCKYLKIYLDDRVKNDKVDDENKDALFLSLQNRRITSRQIEKLVSKYAKIATPLKHITPHKLRSTYGTNLYKETGDIYLVADVLGHNDVNTTKKHYAAIEDERKRLARNIVKLRDD